MHHVAVALDHQEFLHLNRARSRHPAHVVSAQIHEHEMLGPLLLVGSKLPFQFLVFLRGPAAFSGARNGAHRNPLLFQPDQNFR